MSSEFPSALTRVCRDCGAPKLLEHLCRDKTCKYGRSTLCLDCKRERNQLRQNSEPEALKAYRRDYYERNRDGILARSAQNRRRQGIPIKANYDRKRRGEKRTPEEKKAWRVAYNARRKFEIRAMRKAHYALKKGRIVKPDKCSKCGRRPTKKNPLEMYQPFKLTMPLHIIWLHRSCRYENIVLRKRGPVINDD